MKTPSAAGKGDSDRVTNFKAYRRGYQRIFRKPAATIDKYQPDQPNRIFPGTLDYITNRVLQ